MAEHINCQKCFDTIGVLSHEVSDTASWAFSNLYCLRCANDMGIRVVYEEE